MSLETITVQRGPSHLYKPFTGAFTADFTAVKPGPLAVYLAAQSKSQTPKKVAFLDCQSHESNGGYSFNGAYHLYLADNTKGYDGAMEFFQKAGNITPAVLTKLKQYDVMVVYCMGGSNRSAYAMHSYKRYLAGLRDGAVGKNQTVVLLEGGMLGYMSSNVTKKYKLHEWKETKQVQKHQGDALLTEEDFE